MSHFGRMRRIIVSVGGLGLVACGGQSAEPPLEGGGGYTTTPITSVGSQNATGTPSTSATGTPSTTTTGTPSTNTAVHACYPKTGTISFNVAYTFDIGPFAPDDDTCIYSVAMRDDLKLNPDFAAAYFVASNGAKYVIPFVGTLADCASATTYGGWYATNITGGSTDIGLCACTCVAAHQYAVKLAIDKQGVRW